jgi:hypothetical protein
MKEWPVEGIWIGKGRASFASFLPEVRLYVAIWLAFFIL